MILSSNRFTFSLLSLSLTAILSTTGCATMNSARMRDVLDAGIVTFDHHQVPEALVNTLSGKRVLLFGETHYVQEHQEFVLELLKRLHSHGLRWFTQEMAHAYGWIVEDYVLGLRDDYPDSVRRMDEYWIEGLRSFNMELPEPERIRVRYIDMNHAHDALALSLWWMARGTAAGEQIGPVAAGVLGTKPGTGAYEKALRELDTRLEAERDTLVDTLGPAWYDRLTDAVKIEIRSIPVRKQHDVHVRERIMIDLAMRTIENAGESGVAINVGMYHAQKRRYMGTRQEWLGEYLASHANSFGGADRLYSIAFWGFGGEQIRNFMDRDPQPVPAAIERPVSSLSRQIAQVVAQRDGSERPESAAFLELSHPEFGRYMHVAFTHSQLRVVPNRQFDAYVIFPTMSILQSIRRTW